MIATAVDKAVLLMESMAAQSTPCRVCRGGWFFDDEDECFGSVHSPECPHLDDDPPASNQESRPE